MTAQPNPQQEVIVEATATISTGNGQNGKAKIATRTKRPAVARPTKVAEATGDVTTDMLDSYRFEYELELVPISKIDQKNSHLNQARIAEPIDEDQVILYAQSMSDGAVFPPIVVFKRGALYIVLDGNHRVAAAEMADVASLRAYVVKDPTPAQITAFTFAANTRHGLPTSLQDRVRQAIHMVEKGVKAADAAKQLGIPLTQLRSGLDTYYAEKRFRSLGIKKFDALTKTTQKKLDSIKSDTVLKAAAELTLDARLNGDEVTGLVRRINLLRENKQQLDLVSAERAGLNASIKATAGGHVPVPKALVTLQRYTSGIGNIESADLSKAAESLTDDARKEFAQATQAAGARLIQLASEFGKSA
jgi:hypothetical protein